MSLADKFKKLMLRKSFVDSETDEFMAGGRRNGENDNPYLCARRTWNDHVGAIVASRRTWQMVGILSLLIALAGVGGMIHYRAAFLAFHAAN